MKEKQKQSARGVQHPEEPDALAKKSGQTQKARPGPESDLTDIEQGYRAYGTEPDQGNVNVDRRRHGVTQPYSGPERRKQ
jgi:hypothetical protein